MDRIGAGSSIPSFRNIGATRCRGDRSVSRTSARMDSVRRSRRARWWGNAAMRRCYTRVARSHPKGSVPIQVGLAEEVLAEAARGGQGSSSRYDSPGWMPGADVELWLLPEGPAERLHQP